MTRARHVPALLLATFALAACVSPRLGPATMTLPQGGAELPGRWTAGLFLLRARLHDDREHWLLLDTGTDRTLLDLALCERLGLAPGRDTSIVAATGAEVHGRQLPPVPLLRLGDVELRDVDAAAIDLQQLRDHAELPIEGIAGCDLFRHCLLRIDVPGRSVRALPLAAAPTSPPFAFTGRVPIVPATICGREVQLLVDTGFQSTLAIPPDLDVPWRIGPRFGGELATLDGVADHGSGRLAGDLIAGSVRATDPWTMQAIGQPKLGVAALRRTVLTLDACEGRIWLELSNAPERQRPPRR